MHCQGLVELPSIFFSVSVVESRLKTDPELKKKLLSVAATLQEGQFYCCIKLWLSKPYV